jgi:hypothetical protein
MKEWLLLLFYFFFLAKVVNAQDTTGKPIPLMNKGSSLRFDNPSLRQNLKKIPCDLKQVFIFPFKGKNWVPVVIVTGSSLLMIAFDQPIVDWVKRRSSDIGLHAETNYHIVWQIKGTKIIKIPKNLNTALYQIGEGGSGILLASGLWIYGKIGSDDRAVATAYDIAEVFLTTGLITQLIKRSSGRQSPFKATQDGGEWNWFPSFRSYQQHTSNYDAFPSGHLATLTATVTVLCKNYPEKKWIKPVGLAIMGLSAWAMMNTEVHWAGDYPLALAIGFISGKITADRHWAKKATLVQVDL